MIPFVVSAVLTAALTVYGLKQLRAEGFDTTTAAFVALVGSATIWTVTRTLQWLFTSEPLTQLWLGLLYIGYGGSTLATFFFAMSFTGRTHWLSKRRVVLLTTPAVLAFGLGMTNAAGWHTLFWTGDFTTHSSLYILDRDFQLLFFVYLAYVQVLLYTGNFLLVKMAIGSPKVYRRQTIAFVIGSLAPIVLGVMFGLGITPGVPEFVDLTPVGFAITGVAFGYGIFQYKMLDLVPVARDTVIESMRDGYVVLDQDDRIVDLNNAATEALEDRDEVIGEEIGAVLPQCVPMIDDHEHGTQTETEVTIEIDGAQRFFVVNISSLYDDERLIGRLLLIRDVTERRAVQKRYQALIENSSDLITVADRERTITYVSPSIRNIIGVEPDQVIGMDALEYIHNDDQPVVEQAFRELIDNPGEKRRVEYRLADTDGNWLYMESEIWNLLDNPFVEGLVTNAREITERKKREQELRETNEQLTETNERLDQFASVISHDLRNPINVAKGHTQIARETGDEESFEKIEDSLERMETIIDDVLALARQGEDISEMHSVSLESVVNDAWEHVDTKAATLEIETETAVQADRDRLLQLLENCIRNAIEHGGNDVTVRIGSLSNGFYIEDDGPGIPADKRDEIFESGTTTNAAGTGLGLSIVSQIANAHGWTVSATDGSDGGARFEFTGVKQD